MELLLIIGVFGFVASLIYILLAPHGVEQEVVGQRLEAIATRKTSGTVRLLAGPENNFWENIANFFLGEKDLPGTYTKLRQLLHAAGYPWERALKLFLGVRIFLALLLGVLTLLICARSLASVPQMLLLTALFTALGYTLPKVHLQRKAAARIMEIQEALPDTLDLLVVCVEAGLSLDAAFIRVAKEQTDQGLLVGAELQLMTNEIQAGVARKEAMSRLADRIGVEELKGLLTFLMQTEELGGSVARSLRVYADTMRDKRTQKAEEAARKAVIKLMFPIVLFILPALFLVIFAPIAVNIMKMFSAIGD
ncbi:MAG TPA: type II secretion system F family protein [Verrucomicrobiae bacterium]|nr:type II secretion system F family protein [Verrucomicrobiae bacterium]